MRVDHDHVPSDRAQSISGRRARSMGSTRLPRSVGRWSAAARQPTRSTIPLERLTAAISTTARASERPPRHTHRVVRRAGRWGPATERYPEPLCMPRRQSAKALVSRIPKLLLTRSTLPRAACRRAGQPHRLRGLRCSPFPRLFVDHPPRSSNSRSSSSCSCTSSKAVGSCRRISSDACDISRWS